MAIICEVCGNPKESEDASCPHCKEIRFEKFPGQTPRKSGTPKPALDVDTAPVQQTIEKHHVDVEAAKPFIPVVIVGIIVVVALVAIVMMGKSSAMEIEPVSYVEETSISQTVEESSL